MNKLELFVIPLLLPFLANCGSNANTNYLCFTCNSNTGFLGFEDDFSGTETSRLKIEYSKDKVNWIEVPQATDPDSFVEIYSFKKGESIYIRGDNPNGLSHGFNTAGFVTGAIGVNESFSVSGNIMSLLSKDKFSQLSTIPCNRCFKEIFQLTNISDASKLLLPATTLTDWCYNSMFAYCTKLAKPPAKLPAKELTNECYSEMFIGCKNLRVSQDTGNTLFFTCPPTEGLSHPVTNMFAFTGGEFQDAAPIPGHSYYYN